MNQIKNNRLDFVDLLKGIAIYFVVLYHFNKIPIDFINNDIFNNYFNYFIKSIFSICVPIFFFTNGLLLLNKDSFDIKKHITKVIRLIFITIIWGGITLATLSIIRNETLTMYEFVNGIFYLKPDWNSHLWFLGALIIIYIFHPLLFHAYKTNKQIFYFFFICIMFFTFGNVLLGNILTIVSVLTNKFYNTNFNINYFGIFNPFDGIYGYTIGYFMLGGIIFKYRDYLNNKRFRYISICGIITSMILLSLYGIIVSHRQQEIWDIVWSGYDSVFTLLNVFFIFIISLNYKSKWKIGNLITSLGKNSLGIYFLHVIVGNLLKSIFFQMEICNELLANFIFAFVILFTSLFFTLLLKKVPVVKGLFSV